ncbi:hypothetical protein B0H13DRAFT_1882319 [Mycena leptocephala]|nr:hypothetical protein B0H13DRAFT_1882319 [Mycena leptocephala]
MPPKPTITQIRLNNITTCLNLTMCTLETLASSMKSPLLTAMANTTQSLLKNMQSDTGGELPPSVLIHIGKFTDSTKWQQVKKFFRQGEMSTLLKDCKAGLQQGFEIFQMQEDAEKRNKEVLAMIEALSDATSSDGASSVRSILLL